MTYTKSHQTKITKISYWLGPKLLTNAYDPAHTIYGSFSKLTWKNESKFILEGSFKSS